jgi:predicted alpha/beta hydrolase family esterase
MQFLIFHGSFGGPSENWFPELKEQLEALNQKVLSPQFPCEDYEMFTKNGPKQNPENQNLSNWLKYFEKNVLPKISKKEKVCFIGHSIGPVFILHVIEKFQIPLDCAIFVSPFLELKPPSWQYTLVNKSFIKTDFDFVNLKKFIPTSYVLYSDTDPYVSNNLSLDFAQKLGSSTIMVKKAGHLNAEFNLNEFPLVLELCKSRIDFTLYQKYVNYRNRLLSVGSLKNRHEEIIFIKPDEGDDEGVFHFRNLKKGGFCTLYADLDFWNPESEYMKEARNCAKRTGNLTRVMVLNQKEDLNKDTVKKQMTLDKEAGIKVLYCLYDDIKKEVAEPDFGIWDDEYVCIESFNKSKKVKEIILSSRKSDLQRAYEWKKIILKSTKSL